MERMSKDQWVAVAVALVIVTVFFIVGMLFFGPSSSDIELEENVVLEEGHAVEGSDEADTVVEELPVVEEDIEL